MEQSSSSMDLLLGNPSLDLPGDFLNEGFKSPKSFSEFNSTDLDYIATAESNMAPNLTTPFLTSIGQRSDQELIPIGQISLQGDTSIGFLHYGSSTGTSLSTIGTMDTSPSNQKSDIDLMSATNPIFWNTKSDLSIPIASSSGASISCEALDWNQHEYFSSMDHFSKPMCRTVPAHVGRQSHRVRNNRPRHHKRSRYDPTDNPNTLPRTLKRKQETEERDDYTKSNTIAELHKLVIDRLDVWRKEPPSSTEIMGLSLFLGLSYEEVAGSLKGSPTVEPLQIRKVFSSILKEDKNAASYMRQGQKAPDQNWLPDDQVSKNNSSRRKGKNHMPKLQSRIFEAEIPEEVLERAATVSKSMLSSCLQNLTDEMKEKNRHQPHNSDRPYPCLFGCAYTSATPCDFKRHYNQNRPQYGWVCNLSQKWKAPDGHYLCAFCGVVNPEAQHFHTVHKKKVPCCEKEIHIGNGRIFFREDKLRQHFNNVHKGLSFDMRPACGRFEVLNNFEQQCGFCGRSFRIFDERMDHVANHLKEGLTMEKWRIPWKPPPETSNSSDDNDSDDNDDNDDNVHSDLDENGDGGWSSDGAGSRGNGTEDETMDDPRGNSSSGASYYRLSGAKRRSNESPSDGASSTQLSRAIDGPGFGILACLEIICNRPASGSRLLSTSDLNSITQHLLHPRYKPLAFHIRQVTTGQELVLTEESKSSPFWPAEQRSTSFVCERSPWKLITFRKLLGAGSTASVDEVIVEGEASTLARKKFLLLRKDHDRCIEAFLREARILSQLRHHHIIESRSLIMDRQECSILMSPAADYTLGHLLDGDVEITVGKSIRPGDFGCLLSALKYLQESNVVHGDLKPHNILINTSYPEPRWVICDFGVSQNLHGFEASEFTPRYVAPEVASRRPLTYESDIFSLGCIFLEMYLAIRVECSQSRLPPIDVKSDSAYYLDLARVIWWLDQELASKLGRPHRLVSTLGKLQLSTIRDMLDLDPAMRVPITQCLQNFESNECCAGSADASARIDNLSTVSTGNLSTASTAVDSFMVAKYSELAGYASHHAPPRYTPYPLNPALGYSVSKPSGYGFFPPTQGPKPIYSVSKSSGYASFPLAQGSEPTYSMLRQTGYAMFPPTHDFVDGGISGDMKQKKFLCIELGADGMACKSSFVRKADLERHLDSIHRKKCQYGCPVKKCDRKAEKGQGFTRKDHLMRHLRNYHHCDIPEMTKGS